MVSPKVCAYCGTRSAKLTREDVFPQFLMREHPNYSSNLVRRLPGLVLPKPLVVRDVCATCNNVHLSALDNYAASLCRESLRRVVRPGQRVRLSYDHHSLARLLLKVAYNSSRANGEPVGHFRPLIPYILGQVARPPSPHTLFASIIRADTCTADERAAARSPYLFPRGIRHGELDVSRLVGASFGVFLSVTSYMFLLILWDPALARPKRRALVTAVARRSGLVALPEGRRAIDLPEWVTASREYLSRNSWSGDML